jgi:hypothetical protein
MKTLLHDTDAATLREASLFRRMRALTRAMRKGTAWCLVNGEKVRCGDQCPYQCPLTFVGGVPGRSADAARQVADRLGFTESEANDIMWAADRTHRREPWQLHRRLRSILLRAAGLKEAK